MLCTFCQAETGRDWHICDKCADELAPKIIEEVGDTGDWGLHSTDEEMVPCGDCSRMIPRQSEDFNRCDRCSN